MTTAAGKIDGGKTMAEMWAGFAEAVIPFSPAGSMQHEEMRKAFYSGGLCLFNWFMVQLDPEAEPTEGDLDRVDKLEKEIRAFLAAATGERSIQ